MKRKAWEWAGALLFGGVVAGFQYGVARLFGHSDPDWANVVLAGTVLFQTGKNWERY